MSFEEARCLVPICDACGPDWSELQQIPHMSATNIRVAREILARDHGWQIIDNGDGTFDMLCPACKRTPACPDGEHDWFAPEIDWSAPISIDPDDQCRACGRVRSSILDSPPSGHPDSMTVELGDAAEEYLAELDALLDPEAAM